MVKVNFHNLIEFFADTGEFVIFNSDIEDSKNDAVVQSVMRDSGVWKNVVTGKLLINDREIKKLKFFISFNNTKNLTPLNQLKEKFHSTKNDKSILCYIFEILENNKKKRNPKSFTVKVSRINGGGNYEEISRERVDLLDVSKLSKIISNWANVVGIENTSFEFSEVEELSGGYGVGGSKFIREKTYI